MKIRRILFCMATIAISQISIAQNVQTAAQVPALDVDKQLQYCHKQVKRALAELQQKDGSYDYTMEPRNILKGDKQKGWNCRKATPEEKAKAVEEYKEKFSNPYRAAEQGYIDEIILPKDTRYKLIQALEMTQNKSQSNPPKKHGNMPL